MNELLITFMASFLVWAIFAGLAILWLIDGKIKREQVFHAFFSALVAWAIAGMVKAVLPIPRPYVTFGVNPLTATEPFGPTFPSQHTVVSFAIAFTIWLHDKKMGVLFIVAAFGVGMGRILSNAHFPLDVIGGVAIGISIAYLFDRFHITNRLMGK